MQDITMMKLMANFHNRNSMEDFSEKILKRIFMNIFKNH